MLKRILVTGGAGYIGATTAHRLRAAGFEPIVLDNLSKGHRRFVSDIEFIHADLTDAYAVHRSLAGLEIDAVVHFAALIEAGVSMRDPLPFYRTNIGGAFNVLDAMKMHGIDKIVFSSTAAVYGVPQTVPIKESQPSKPINPYGATKVAIERMLADCSDAWGLKWIALRYFNAAGADTELPCGEWHDPETHLIPNVLRAAAGEKEHLDLFGVDHPTEDGTAVRDYVHVGDLADAHIAALEQLEHLTGKAYNLGIGRGFSVQEVIRAGEQVTGKQITVQKKPPRPGDPPVLVADPTQAMSELKWKPQYTEIKEIVGSAWQWFSNNGFSS